MYSQDPADIRKQVCFQSSSIPLSSSLDDACQNCNFMHDTEHKPYYGGQCNVFALKDHTGRRVAMRIFHERSLSSAYLLSCELKYRQEIERRGISFFQKVLSSSHTGNQLIKNPFICLTWVDGSPLTWSDSIPKQRLKRINIIKTIANISLDLLDVQEEGISARDELMTKIHRKATRARDGKYSGGSAQGCIKQMSLLEKYWIPHLDTAPRVLVHGDLSPNNIIVNEDFDIRSIIDLGWAEFVPLQFAAAYPRFLTHEPRSNGLFDWTAIDTESMRQDRLVFRECIRERAALEGGICQVYYDLLCREDEVNRYWWFKAISEADKHKAMEACNWSPEPKFLGS